jgi:hypothetical protein
MAKTRKIRFAMIVCDDFQWPGPRRMRRGKYPIIFTVRLPGETEVGIQNKLRKLLSRFPFTTTFRYVVFHSIPEIYNIVDELSIVKIKDYPGAKTVVFRAQFECERPFFLPRNFETGEFIDINKQVRCLSVLMWPDERKDWVIRNGVFVRK